MRSGFQLTALGPKIITVRGERLRTPFAYIASVVFVAVCIPPTLLVVALVSACALTFGEQAVVLVAQCGFATTTWAFLHQFVRAAGVTRLYQCGARQDDLFNSRALLFSCADAVTFQVSRQCHVLSVDAWMSPPLRVRASARCARTKARLRTVLEAVVAEVAGDWQWRLDAGKSVRWGQGVTLYATEIVLNGDEHFPLDATWKASFDGDFFRASRGGYVSFELPWNEENFLPGLRVFENRTGIGAVPWPCVTS